MDNGKKGREDGGMCSQYKPRALFVCAEEQEAMELKKMDVVDGMNKLGSVVKVKTGKIGSTADREVKKGKSVVKPVRGVQVKTRKEGLEGESVNFKLRISKPRVHENIEVKTGISGPASVDDFKIKKAKQGCAEVKVKSKTRKTLSRVSENFQFNMGKSGSKVMDEVKVVPGKSGFENVADKIKVKSGKVDLDMNQEINIKTRKLVSKVTDAVKIPTRNLGSRRSLNQSVKIKSGRLRSQKKSTNQNTLLAAPRATKIKTQAEFKNMRSEKLGSQRRIAQRRVTQMDWIDDDSFSFM